MKNIDWFEKLKLDVVDLVLLFKEVKKTTVLMLLTNRWILEDANLFVSFSHLKEMIDVSEKDLNELIKFIIILDERSIIFDKTDLLEEFEFIKENIHLESGFITNMINYMGIIDNPFINDIQINEEFEKYLDNDISCYNQMKINYEQLKILKKERGDL